MTQSREDELMQLREELSELKLKYESILKAEHNLQSSQAIFLRNLSQNIRIPMNGVRGMIDVLQMTKLDGDQKDYIGLIANYSDNVMVIMNDILDYSNLMNNTFELSEDYFEIGKLVEEIQQLLSIRIEGKGLKLIIYIDEKIPKYLYGDPHRIKQILINLLNNSLRHTREGEIRMTIEQLSQEKQKALLKFRISDTGSGMDEDLIRTLRAELTSSDLTTKLSLNGMGVGLAISQTLLKMMNTHLSFESKENGGSEFWFPLSISTRHKNRSGVFNEEKPGLRTLKILLVEDNRLNQKFVKVTLTKQGHLLDIAENGKIAIEKFKSETYDLILMDIQMPVMNGIEATKEIRKIEAEQNLQAIKIIAVTAYALDNKREECLLAGMDDFLPKPFKPNHLVKLIDEIKFS